MKNIAKSTTALLLSIMLLLSSIGPVIAVDTDPITIEDFNIEFVSGAEQTNDGLVYNASETESLSIHRFLYRVNYATSGIGELERGAVVITLPTKVFTDRDGNESTSYDVAIPKETEVQDDDTEVKFVYKVVGDEIQVYNRIAIETAQNGYIEIAYIPTKSSFDIFDMQKHADIHSTITVKHEGETRTQEDTSEGVMINTGAQISNALKCDSPAFFGKWQDSWGLDKPDDADDYYYLTWLITTNLTNVTQYYDFRLDDTFNEVGGEIVAYKFQNSTKYTESNTALHQMGSARHDYVLTRHLKSTYSGLDEYTLHNSVTVTVTPCDGVDPSTSADSTAEFVDGKPTGTDDYGALWDKIPVLFWSAKYGTTTSDYLRELKSGELDRIEGLEYYSRTGGYFDLFASGFGAGNPVFDNKGEMVYSVYDNQLYLNETEANVTNGSVAALDHSDYDIKSVKVTASLYDGVYVEQTHRYTTDFSKPIDRPVEVFAYVSGEYVKIAEYSHVTKEFSNVDSRYATINADFDSTLNFAEGVDGVGAKVTAPAYTCDIYLFPTITLYRTENVLNKLGTNPVARLYNRSTHYAGRLHEQTLDDYYSRVQTGSDVIREFYRYRSSSVTHRVDSAVNNKKQQQYEVGNIAQMFEEDIASYTGSVDNVVQNGGTFYILLPVGASLKQNSVEVTCDSGTIPSSRVGVETVMNYNDSGRTLLKVKIRQEGTNYKVAYKTISSWESINDYGSLMESLVAYETGNDDIYNGRPDDGAGLPYMENLDPETDDNKFIYTTSVYSLLTLTAATSGLMKKTQAGKDEKPSYNTMVNQNGTYLYQLRMANSNVTKCKDIVLYDSFENYLANGQPSDWHGTLSSIDLSNLRDKDINAVVYLSAVENLEIYTSFDLNTERNGERVWKALSDFGDISNAKAIAIDCTKTTGGDDFILYEGESLSANIYMKAPAVVEDEQKLEPKTYNNVYMYETIISKNGNTVSGTMILLYLII